MEKTGFERTIAFIECDDIFDDKFNIDPQEESPEEDQCDDEEK